MLPHGSVSFFPPHHLSCIIAVKKICSFEIVQVVNLPLFFRGRCFFFLANNARRKETARQRERDRSMWKESENSEGLKFMRRGEKATNDERGSDGGNRSRSRSTRWYCGTRLIMLVLYGTLL